MIKLVFAGLLIFTLLAIGFSALNDSSVSTDLGTQQSTLENLVPPVFSFSLTTILSADKWLDWLDASRTVLSFDYPNILTGTTGTIIRIILIPLQVVTLLTAIALLWGLIRGSSSVSWS